MELSESGKSSLFSRLMQLNAPKKNDGSDERKETRPRNAAVDKLVAAMGDNVMGVRDNAEKALLTYLQENDGAYFWQVREATKHRDQQIVHKAWHIIEELCRHNHGTVWMPPITKLPSDVPDANRIMNLYIQLVLDEQDPQNPLSDDWVHQKGTFKLFVDLYTIGESRKRVQEIAEQMLKR